MPTPIYLPTAPTGKGQGLPPAGYDGSEQRAQDLAALERCERLNECRFCVWGEIDGAGLAREAARG